MLFTPELHGQLARERIEREIATAELLRQTRQPSMSFRQAVGHRFPHLQVTTVTIVAHELKASYALVRAGAPTDAK